MLKNICIVSSNLTTINVFLKEIIIDLSNKYNITIITNKTNDKLIKKKNIKYKFIPIKRKPNFISDLKTVVLEVNNGIGFCYWGAELIAWEGENSENGSVWENQALFDFNNVELPVLQEFRFN